VAAPPQVPEWWNEPLAEKAPTAASAAPTKKPKPTRPRAAGQDALFTVSSGEETPAVDVVDELLASPTYAHQRRMAGRGALPDTDVAAFLRAILQRGERAHQDTVAAAAGIATSDLGQRFAAVKRLLNVDGYEVLKPDSDGVTYRVDVALLREQFELGGQ
jgi:hypothetical protein